jgi:hypothetical protein
MTTAKPRTKAKQQLMELALDVKRGERTYDSLSDERRKEVRAYLHTAPDRELRTFAQEQSPVRRSTIARQSFVSNVRSH